MPLSGLAVHTIVCGGLHRDLCCRLSIRTGSAASEVASVTAMLTVSMTGKASMDPMLRRPSGTHSLPAGLTEKPLLFTIRDLFKRRLLVAAYAH